MTSSQKHINGRKSLQDKIAVVTGPTSGIGKAIAENLAKHGTRLCLVGRNMIKLKRIAGSLREGGAVVSIYQADLALDGDVLRLIDRLNNDLRHIEIMIHGAGVIVLGKIEETSVEAFDFQHKVNVRAPYMLTRGLLPLLRLGGAHVIFLNSTAGLSARAGIGQYAATKHALKALADTLREEENGNGLRVLSVYIGRTATPMQETIFEKEGRKYSPEVLLQPEDVAQVVVDVLRAGNSAEITDLKCRSPIKFE